MENSKIAILILSTNVKSYKVFVNAIRESWYIDAKRNGYKVFFYSGGHSEDVVYGTDEIRVTENDTLSNCYRKFVAAKNVLINSFPEVELIYRTNLSSYIDVDNFSRYIKNASFTKKSYHGFRWTANKYSEMYYNNRVLHLFFKYLHVGPVINFFSGAGFFIGIDLCNTLSFDEKKNYLIDDVEIGSQIIQYNNHDISYERIHITDTYIKINFDEYETMVKNGLLFHYKFKTKDRVRDAFLLQKFTDLEFRKAFLTI